MSHLIRASSRLQLGVRRAGRSTAERGADAEPAAPRSGAALKKLAASAGLPEIDLHDVRHSYATVGRDAKMDWKALSKRIGHSDVAFTMKQYVQTDLEADRQVAHVLARLIIGGALISAEVIAGDGGDEAA